MGGGDAIRGRGRRKGRDRRLGCRPGRGVQSRGPGPELEVAGRRGRGASLWKVARGARSGCGALGWRVGGTGAGRPLLSRLTSLLLPAWGGDPLRAPLPGSGSATPRVSQVPAAWN